MNENAIKKAYEFARDYHCNDCSGHDFEHIKRVFSNVCALMKETSECNEFIVKISALLHDIDDWKLKTDGNNTLKFLQSINLEQNIIDEILSTIDAISFSKCGSNPNLKTVEMKLLFDADKLDAMGAIGLCRTIMFSACHNRPLFDENIFPEANLTQEAYKNITRKENNTINHFFDKLLKLKNAMQTDAGKKEAQKRHEFMVFFLNQFFAEQNLNEWQKYLEHYLKESETNKKNNISLLIQ